MPALSLLGTSALDPIEDTARCLFVVFAQFTLFAPALSIRLRILQVYAGVFHLKNVLCTSALDPIEDTARPVEHKPGAAEKEAPALSIRLRILQDMYELGWGT